MITCKNIHGELVTLPKEKFKICPRVYGFIRNKDNICIAKIKSTGKFWLPGGGVEAGESKIDALLREIKEETGITNVEVGKLLGSFENFFYDTLKNEAWHALIDFYECKTQENFLAQDKNTDDYPFIEPQWIPLDQLQKDDFNDLNEEIFNILKSLL